MHNWPVMGGLGNVGDNVFDAPAVGTYRGMSVRAFDTKPSACGAAGGSTAADPATIASSVAGTFENGVGTLTGDDEIDGRKVQVRSRWSDITAKSAALGTGDVDGRQGLGNQLDARISSARG